MDWPRCIQIVVLYITYLYNYSKYLYGDGAVYYKFN